jgi:hypothetical protein
MLKELVFQVYGMETKMKKLDWKPRVVGFVGMRGSGKSTLINRLLLGDQFESLDDVVLPTDSMGTATGAITEICDWQQYSAPPLSRAAGAFQAWFTPMTIEECNQRLDVARAAVKRLRTSAAVEDEDGLGSATSVQLREIVNAFEQWVHHLVVDPGAFPNAETASMSDPKAFAETKNMQSYFKQEIKEFMSGPQHKTAASLKDLRTELAKYLRAVVANGTAFGCVVQRCLIVGDFPELKDANVRLLDIPGCGDGFLEMTERFRQGICLSDKLVVVMGGKVHFTNKTGEFLTEVSEVLKNREDGDAVRLPTFAFVIQHAIEISRTGYVTMTADTDLPAVMKSTLCKGQYAISDLWRRWIGESAVYCVEHDLDTVRGKRNKADQKAFCDRLTSQFLKFQEDEIWGAWSVELLRDFDRMLSSAQDVLHAVQYQLTEIPREVLAVDAGDRSIFTEKDLKGKITWPTEEWLLKMPFVVSNRTRYLEISEKPELYWLKQNRHGVFSLHDRPWRKVAAVKANIRTFIPKCAETRSAFKWAKKDIADAVLSDLLNEDKFFRLKDVQVRIENIVIDHGVQQLRLLEKHLQNAGFSPAVLSKIISKHEQFLHNPLDRIVKDNSTSVSRSMSSILKSFRTATENGAAASTLADEYKQNIVAYDASTLVRKWSAQQFLQSFLERGAVVRVIAEALQSSVQNEVRALIDRTVTKCIKRVQTKLNNCIYALGEGKPRMETPVATTVEQLAFVQPLLDFPRLPEDAPLHERLHSLAFGPFKKYLPEGLDNIRSCCEAHLPASNNTNPEDVGWVYVARENGSGDNTYKLGSTQEEDPNKRVRKIGGQSRKRYRLQIEWKVRHYAAMERLMHSLFDKVRVESDREFFSVPLHFCRRVGDMVAENATPVPSDFLLTNASPVQRTTVESSQEQDNDASLVSDSGSEDDEDDEDFTATPAKKRRTETQSRKMIYTRKKQEAEQYWEENVGKFHELKAAIVELKRHPDFGPNRNTLYASYSNQGGVLTKTRFADVLYIRSMPVNGDDHDAVAWVLDSCKALNAEAETVP